jgi:hypothetical protein
MPGLGVVILFSLQNYIRRSCPSFGVCIAGWITWLYSYQLLSLSVEHGHMQVQVGLVGSLPGPHCRQALRH